MPALLQVWADVILDTLYQFFTLQEGRKGVVVTFLALMELTRERLVDIVQNEPMGKIYIKSPE